MVINTIEKNKAVNRYRDYRRIYDTNKVLREWFTKKGTLIKNLEIARGMSPIDLWVMNMATIVQGFHLGFV
jgi:hypothetical protein